MYSISGSTRWRKKEAAGEVIVVRYADDFIIGFQNKVEAERCLAALRERFARFQLELHPEKDTPAGVWAVCRREPEEDREGKTGDLRLPGVHAHLRSNPQAGQAHRPAPDHALTDADEAARTPRGVPASAEPPRERDGPVVTQCPQGGYYRYHAVPRNLPARMSFYRRVGQMWHRTLERRSHKGRIDWRRMYRLINRWLPTPRVMHPYPEHRLAVTT
jgi:hypothetical protein